MRERKEKKYLNKLMFHNQLFHKSKTNAGFISVLVITQFCILFYFAFQIGGTLIAEEPEDMFPYDFVCYADEFDDELFADFLVKKDVISSKQAKEFDVFNNFEDIDELLDAMLG